MKSEYILHSLSRIIKRHARTVSPLKYDTSVGSETIYVKSTRRFKKGDEIIIRSPTKGETKKYIDEVIDEYQLRLTERVKFLWTVDDGCVVEKTFNQMFLQGIYYGEPVNIPRFPAVTIKLVSNDSEWIALKQTKEKYNVQITVYVENGSQEESYLWLTRMTDTISEALKQNIYPLIGPYNTYSLLANASVGDYFIKVSDTSQFWTPARCYIEDAWNYQEIAVKRIVDSTTLELANPLCYDFTVSDNPLVILMNRWIYNSWAPSVNYGTIFKGTSLKASTIDWFCEEAVDRVNGPSEPHLS